MREHEHVALFQVGLDVLLVHVSLKLIIDQDHDDVGPLCRLGVGHDLDALLLSLRTGLGALVQTDTDIDAGFLQVQRMGVALAAVADDRNSVLLQNSKVAVFLIIDLHCHDIYSSIHC